MIEQISILLEGFMICLTMFWTGVFWFGRQLFERKELPYTIPLRRWTTFLGISLTIGYLNALIFFYPPCRTVFFRDLCMLIDSLSIPICFQICIFLTRSNWTGRRNIIINFLLFVLAIPTYLLFPSRTTMHILITLIAIYIIIFAIYIIRRAIRYEQELKDLYSSMYGHSIKWMIIVILLFAAQSAIWITYILHPSIIFSISYSILSFITWSYAFTYLLRMITVMEEAEERALEQSLLIDSPHDKEHKPIDIEKAEPNTDNSSADSGSTFLDLLQQKCVQTELYTNEDLTRDQLAIALHINPPRFTKLLHEYTGKNFYEYINSLRNQHAARLLLEEKTMDVGSIGYISGYRYRSTFYRAFSAEYGCTPAEYRDQHAH